MVYLSCGLQTEAKGPNLDSRPYHYISSDRIFSGAHNVTLEFLLEKKINHSRAKQSLNF